MLNSRSVRIFSYGIRVGDEVDLMDPICRYEGGVGIQGTRGILDFVVNNIFIYYMK